LWCFNNQLTSLDVSNNTALINVMFNNNQLTSLDLSNNSLLENIRIESMSSLTKVCVWTMPFPPTGVGIDTTGSPNVYFTADCSK